ncbi:nuclear transport factor 2 family protein [Methyloceanibacter stevinii]|uniref:nuclear transport factor 2 family protein n=1 Tax=Methyloceanibacter stevinii TaxID=1774970 RepID=UPI0009F1664D|nr:nuclear transport factor 2 family protein [Methyloceanibacter stevinii]
MIKILATLITCIFLTVPAFADERLADVEAIDNAVGQLDEAFATDDPDALKALMTEDHIAVLPFHQGPETVEQMIDGLSKTDIKQTDLSEPTVVFLGPDSAMRTLTAKFEGTYEDKPVDSTVFITSIMTKKDGKWLESFYQVTTIAP